MREPTLRYLSLGAGRQSTALYILACDGRFGSERPDVAIFADTQDEPADVYRHLDRLEAAFGAVIPIMRVTAGSLSKGFLAQTGTNPPFFVRHPNGEKGILGRNCTRDYKITPIHREVKRRIGFPGRKRVPPGVFAESWQGISRDEATRMKSSPVPWVKNRYPLVLELGWSADDCHRYNVERGFDAPKSACVYCPFASDARWRVLKQTSPDDFAEAVRIDRALRSGGLRSVTLPAYVHSSLTPLEDVDFASAEERGQVNMFENECEGMCGV